MSQTEDVDWELVSKVRSSRRRSQVLQKLSEQPMMNGEIADEFGVSTAYIRKHVKTLERMGLVEELTDDKWNYKIYGVTEKGEEISEHLIPI